MTTTIKVSPTSLIGGSGHYSSQSQKITSLGQALDAVTRAAINGTDGSLWGAFPQALGTVHRKLQISLECAGANLEGISSQLTKSAQAFSKLDATLAATFQDLANQAPLYTSYTSSTATPMPLVPCYVSPFAPPTSSSSSKSSLPGWMVAGGSVLLVGGMIASAFFPPAWEDEPALGAGLVALDGTEAAAAGAGTITAGGALDGASLVIDTTGLSTTDAQLLSQIETADNLLKAQSAGVP